VRSFAPPLHTQRMSIASPAALFALLALGCTSPNDANRSSNDASVPLNGDTLWADPSADADDTTGIGPDSGAQPGTMDDAQSDASAPSETPDAGDAPEDNPCEAMSASGVHLNPGCDPELKLTGISALAMFENNGQQTWLVTSGRSWWLYDGEAFVNAGPDVASFFRTLEPRASNLEQCAATVRETTDGGGNVWLNPGCDPAVMENGLSTLSTFVADGAASWIVTSGTKWWTYGAAAELEGNAFTGAGASAAGALRQWAPAVESLDGCETVAVRDGVPINPGCDATVQQSGLSAMSALTIDGKRQFLLSSGTKWWVYQQPEGAATEQFTDSGNLAAFMRRLEPIPPDGDCQRIAIIGGVPRNPGCDPSLQSIGLTAMSAITIGGESSWFIVSGRKWWRYGRSEPLEANAFIASGDDVSATFRRLFKP
jgi:hypothetical protein